MLVQTMDDMHSLDFEKVAEVRQGYGLRVIKEVGMDDRLKSGEAKSIILTLEPVFMVLNPETLSFYMNENINSLTYS